MKKNSYEIIHRSLIMKGPITNYYDIDSEILGEGTIFLTLIYIRSICNN